MWKLPKVSDPHKLLETKYMLMHLLVNSERFTEHGELTKKRRIMIKLKSLILAQNERWRQA